MIIYSNSSLRDDYPLICYQNLVTNANVTATSENTDYPVSNVANPSLANRWESTSDAVQYVTSTFSDQEIDYVAITGHNFGSQSVTFSIEVDISSTWTEVIPDSTVSNDNPLVLFFDPQTCDGVRIKISSTVSSPTISVMYAGLALKLDRKIYVGHTPISHSKISNIVNGLSENGQFVGRIVVGDKNESTIELSNIDPNFFRNEIKPFFENCETYPFFFVWRPNEYQSEVGFCWSMADGSMQNQLPNGMVSIDMPIQGIVEGREISVSAPTTVNMTFSSDQNDVNLRTEYDLLFAAPTDDTSISVTIESGVTIGSTSTATPALDIGTWPSGTTITIIHNGKILGAGGAGGDAPDGEGNDGGDAITAARAVTIDLAGGGEILDGAGGGAADTTNGGGGGAGSTGGAGGAADGGTAGNAGTETAGGTASGNAGAGGAPGQIGADSDAADGGDSGCTIDDNPLITVLNQGSGTITGCNVNSSDFGSITMNISTDQVDYNLRTAYDGLSHPTPTASTVLVVNIENGVTISASDATTNAFDVGTWPAGADITININGVIKGAGGDGGDAADGAGQDGGDAFVTTVPVTIDFADLGSGADGEISGGGGGGEAGTLDGGGGGAGDIVGAGGSDLTLLDGGHTVGSDRGGGNTHIDRSFSLPNSVTVTRLGAYSDASATIHMKICLQNSTTNFDIEHSESFSHGGTGWEDFEISTPFVVPASGTYNIGSYDAVSRPGTSESIARSSKTGNVTGDSQSGFTADTGGSMLVNATYIAATSGNDGTATTGGSGATSGVSLIAQGDGTIIGDMTDRAGLSAAFDGNANQANNDSATSENAGGDAYIGKTFSAAKTVIEARVHGGGGSGFSSSTPNITLKLYGKNGTAPSSRTDGTLIATEGPFTDPDDATQQTIDASSNTTAYDHVWVSIEHDGSSSNNIFCCEVEFYEPGIASGDGGDLGEDGYDNTGVQSGTGAGSAGNAIDGVTNVTKLNAGDGTINGPEIN